MPVWLRAATVRRKTHWWRTPVPLTGRREDINFGRYLMLLRQCVGGLPCGSSSRQIRAKTQPADDLKSSGYPADPNPSADRLSPDTFTQAGRREKRDAKNAASRASGLHPNALWVAVGLNSFLTARVVQGGPWDHLRPPETQDWSCADEHKPAATSFFILLFRRRREKRKSRERRLPPGHLVPQLERSCARAQTSRGVNHSYYLLTKTRRGRQSADEEALGVVCSSNHGNRALAPLPLVTQWTVPGTLRQPTLTLNTTASAPPGPYPSCGRSTSLLDLPLFNGTEEKQMG
ncbi:hypothetical protein SKAU_G00111330 [Synaphobranchus kaupii]|uniref:Uncharacterized protein n=1 Tax=Synaphobranchus kaupii TaxID=118154 RepID=A0A9Q1G0G6_SYNKA|nr:hypothetical protein SKAU_G00111330 [Synaphobranchus kaupii]